MQSNEKIYKSMETLLPEAWAYGKLNNYYQTMGTFFKNE
jgi:hypothetical protein